jgi:nicotinamidase/pyrazinamidase
MMEIVDKVYVIGRGNIVVCDDVKSTPLHIGDKVTARGLVFDIVGIESHQYTKAGGLILRPNDKVEEIKIKDKIEKVMKKKVLLVIDGQEDFLDGGKLGVNGARNIMDNLANNYIPKHGNDYEFAIATVDYHPFSHCSFKENGGIWPAHCIQHSAGAAIYEPLLQSLHNNMKFLNIFTKGVDDDHEEYSIFKNEESCKKLVDLINKFEIEEIDVVGIAYDYCVADSVKDGLRNLPNVTFRVLKDYCPAIAEDSAKVFTDFVNSTERVCLVEG